MATDKTVVQCSNVHKRYEHDGVEVHALRGVDLQLAAGEFVSLSGPSGSGKTTLLNAVGGLDSITSGEITVEGRRVDLMDRDTLSDMRLRRVGFVFQSYNLIPVLSARENVEFIMQLQGVPADERRARALEMLRAVGLENMADRRPARMSGGQQQRVAVARSLVSRPAIVLADEPSANLDSATTESLLSLMADLNRRYHVTFLIATHDARVIAHTRRRIQLVDGVIAEDRTVETAAAD